MLMNISYNGSKVILVITNKQKKDCKGRLTQEKKEKKKKQRKGKEESMKVKENHQ